MRFSAAGPKADAARVVSPSPDSEHSGTAGRAAADLDVAELLLRRAVDTAQTPSPPSLALRARTMRDCARSAELCVSAIDALIAMSGAAAFAANHPIQRAWRDIHFASMHVSLNPEQNFAHFGRTELGLPRDSHQPFF